MSKKDAEELGWYKRPLMLMLENGTWIIPQQDDEGNDGGALWLMNNTKELKETLAPVITIDDDMQHSGNEILKLYEHIVQNKLDAVFGSFKRRMCSTDSSTR